MNKHSVTIGIGGWWGHLKRPGWRMDRGPYRWRWMAALSFPIARWTWKGGFEGKHQ